MNMHTWQFEMVREYACGRGLETHKRADVCMMAALMRVVASVFEGSVEGLKEWFDRGIGGAVKKDNIMGGAVSQHLLYWMGRLSV
jgi:hypothetical protein